LHVIASADTPEPIADLNWDMAVAGPTPPVSARRPLSLRDLLSLVTLLCATIVLLGLPNWGEEERWLIGPAVLATLLGIFAGRALKWPAWRLGLVVGGAGAALGTWLNCRWLTENYPWYPSPELCRAAKGAISGTAILGGAVAGLIVLATLSSFALLQWVTSTHFRGVVPLLRKCPRRGAAVLAGVGVLVWCVSHIDRVLWPSAWPVRTMVPFQRGGQRIEPKNRLIQLALSHDGKYLATSFRLSQHGCTWVHEVAGSPRRILLPEAQANQHYDPAFVERSNTLALTRWEHQLKQGPISIYEPVLIQLWFDVTSGNILHDREVAGEDSTRRSGSHNLLGVPSPTGQVWIFAGHRLVHRSHVELDPRGLTTHTWLDFVPLLRCINSWRRRDYIGLLDPVTGREVARTQPISPCILNVVLSHDGSTMAVATWEGVYLFDVPKEFR
jgi:hypothetical protein